MKLISFSLWGNNPKYNIGAIKNSILQKKIYPDWKCRFYCAPCVSDNTINELLSNDCEVIKVNKKGDWKFATERFKAIDDDVEAVIFRDADSRLNERESEAVHEWLQSSKSLHVMKDHPYHGSFPILAGMWGIKKQGFGMNMTTLLSLYNNQEQYHYDQIFLRDYIWRFFSHDHISHDEFFGGSPFPSHREGLEFVGKVFDENEETILEHEELLRRSLLNKSSLYILPHLGLGDHILCNAIVNTFSEQRRIVMYCKHHNINNVKRMHPNVDLISVDDDQDAVSKINKVLKKQSAIFLGLGNFGSNFMNNSSTFDQSFYMQSGVPYNDRWNKFSFSRDKKKEEVVMKTKPKGKFLFVHDDASRGLSVRKKYLPKGVELYRPNHNLGDNSEITIFDYIPLIEQSEEIHCMDSSFAAMIDHIDSLRSKKKYIHRYIRKENLNPFYKNNWKIIE